jgi:hypothetical protein
VPVVAGAASQPVVAAPAAERVIAGVPEQRVVAGQAEQAIAKRDQAVIGHMTPHTLRRTFASVLAEVGVPPRRAMYLLGDTDPTLPMRVYQQVLDMGGAVVGQLKGVLGCMIQEEYPRRGL